MHVLAQVLGQAPRFSYGVPDPLFPNSGSVVVCPQQHSTPRRACQFCLTKNQGFSKFEDPGKGLVTQEKYGADMARLHRIFFGYGADTAQMHRIFWLFWLAYALNQTGSFAVALYRSTMVCS